jgi:hypothetical protein
MKEAFLKFIKDKELVRQLWNVIRICWSTLGIVYLFGRMLNLMKLPIQKNTLAAFVLIFNTAGIIFIENKLNKTDFIYELWAMYLYFSIAITVYVWIFWKSYDRIDYLLDKKGLKDRGIKTWFKKRRAKK